MELTQEVLSRFVGGQLEVQSCFGFTQRSVIDGIEMTPSGWVEVHVSSSAYRENRLEWTRTDISGLQGFDLIMATAWDADEGRIGVHWGRNGSTFMLFLPGDPTNLDLSSATLQMVG